MAEPKVEELPTYKINEVEVFSAGTWNKDTYTLDDLHKMVEAFNNLKEGFRPYLKLGHDNNQKLAKSSGAPSLGWVERLYIRGQKLYADFNHIPKKIFELIKAKAYRKVSCEIYWDLDVAGNKYPRVLGAVALLGAETPGVLNLTDILGNYSINLEENMVRVFNDEKNQDSLKAYEVNFNPIMEDEMTEELQKVQTELDAEKKNYAKAQEELTAKQAALDAQAAELLKFREEAAKAQEEARAAKVAKFVTEMESKKLVTPAMRDLITELMSDKKEYTVKEKQLSKEEVLEQILTLSTEAAKVNFDESSRADFGKKEDKMQEMECKVQEYMQANKGTTYGQAVKAVAKGMKPEDKQEEEK